MAKKKGASASGQSAPAASAGEEIVNLDPAVIYFTFSRIRPFFSCGRTIESTTQQFQRGELKPTDLPLLSVFVSNGATSTAMAAASGPARGGEGKSKGSTAAADYETAPTAKGKRGNKKGKRRGDDSSESDGDGNDDAHDNDGGRRGKQNKASSDMAPTKRGGASASAASGAADGSTLFYFSQNNRRLYMYKQLREMGLLETVPVRLKPLPQTRRMAQKYTPEKCSLTATLQREGGIKPDRDGSPGSGEDGEGDDNDDDEGDDDDGE